MSKPFYRRQSWISARKQALFDANWECQRCGCSLVGLGKAAQVHHRKPLKDAHALGLEPLNLMPLCAPCHNQLEPRDGSAPKAMSACDVDGTPRDPMHPWNR